MENNKKVRPKTLAGFMELLPNDQIIFNEMKEKIKRSYEKFGFLPLDTPVMEMAEILLAKAGGETEKQIYRFYKGDHDLALRFDLTVPLAKYVAMHQNELAFPFRRYQIGKVYRGERPQKGRFREFYQCDIDIIGDNELNIMNDAEMPSVIYETFKELGFDDFTICINNRKILNGLFEELQITEQSQEILRIIDKLEKIGMDSVRKELEKLGIETEKVEKIERFILIQGQTEEKLQQLKDMKIQNEMFLQGVKELKEVVNYISLLGVPKQNYIVDLTIARGLDYYTGTVYETFLNEYRQIGSVCSGGRYDNLAESYTDKKLPGVGISIGLTRLFYKLNELKQIKAVQNSIAQVLVVSLEKNASVCLPVANAFRKANINAQVYMEDKRTKAKFKYADRWQIPYIVVLGEQELEKGIVSLKDMKTGMQQELKIEQAIEWIKQK